MCVRVCMCVCVCVCVREREGEREREREKEGWVGGRGVEVEMILCMWISSNFKMFSHSIHA